jgi:hypothetical protein
MNSKKPPERSESGGKRPRQDVDPAEPREAAPKQADDDRRTAGTDEDGRVPPGANGEDF